MGMNSFDIQAYADYRSYLLSLGEDNKNSRNRLIRNLRMAITDELTSRQREMVLMYFVEQKNMTEIAQELKVNVSTVSRTIKRGKDRLRRCLKYGAKELLLEDTE